MNKSKRNLENGVDFISNMPDPILQLILQGLTNTEEVVRTSILSTRWRYLWTSIPHFPSLTLKPRTNFKMNSFEKFVSWALANKTVDLDCFRLCCAGYCHMRILEKWIEAASRRKVKKLDLMFWCGRRDITMPVCLITCDSLEVLRLCLYGYTLQMPVCTGFRALKVLELNCVHDCCSDLPEQFIRMCPLLEELSLIECYRSLINVPAWISSLKLKTLILHIREKNTFGLTEYCSDIIDCPELVLLEYVGPIVPSCLTSNSLDNVKKAVILPEDKMQRKISYQRGDDVCETLAGMSHLESLSINLYFIQCIDAARDEEKQFPLFFPNLKTLEVTTTIDAFTLKVLIRILKCSPNLESLHLVIQKEHLTTDYWGLDEVETRTILTRHLKSVKFLGINGEKRRLVIARFLLEHGNVLEEIVFSWLSKVQYHEKSLKMMKKLSKLHKASSTVKLVSVLRE